MTNNMVLETIDAITLAARKHQLYENLINQLNKDFLYANITCKMDRDILPEDLKTKLHEIIYDLIQKRFSDYLNLLYVIDVEEEKVKQLDGRDTFVLSGQVAYLVLKREWEKVWYKYQYS